METREFKKLLLMAGFLCLTISFTQAQYVGVGEQTPGSKLDVVSTVATGNSIEVNHNNTGNTSSATWIRNNGIGRALNVNSLNTGNNISAVTVTQEGTGVLSAGVEVIMDGGTQAPGLAVLQDGSNDGILINPTGAGWGINNVIGGTGSGIYNSIGAGGTFGTVDDLAAGGGIANLAIFNGQDGTGFMVDSIGDGWGLNVNVRTSTPTTAGLVYGAVLGGNQYGVGHGALVNHYGTLGRASEFNIQNTANPDPALIAISLGTGNVVIAQNQNNNIPGTIRVGDFAYTGTDVADHIGVSGFSAPAAGWGVGVEGTGNWYGVLSFGDFGATGVKTFIIDHPQDPENKFLRHFSMESDEVLNVYRGMEELDANGQVTVELPAYFQDINTDFSYQLTPVGTPVQPYIAQEISNNTFVISGAPNTKVSWMVLAERNDLYLQQSPEKKLAEVDKKASQRGQYMQPELYGQAPSLKIGQQNLAQNRVMNRGMVKRTEQQAALDARQGVQARTYRPSKEAEQENIPQQ